MGSSFSCCVGRQAPVIVKVKVWRHNRCWVFPASGKKVACTMPVAVKRMNFHWFYKEEETSSIALGVAALRLETRQVKMGQIPPPPHCNILLKKWEMTTSSVMWPWPERMVSWLKPTRWSWQAGVHKQTPPPSCLVLLPMTGKRNVSRTPIDCFIMGSIWRRNHGKLGWNS